MAKLWCFPWRRSAPGGAGPAMGRGRAPRWVTPKWVTEPSPAGRRVVMGQLVEPAMPYEAWFYGGDKIGYWVTVLEPCLYNNGEPMRDMRRVEFANGVRRSVMLGQLDWDADQRGDEE